MLALFSMLMLATANPTGTGPEALNHEEIAARFLIEHGLEGADPVRVQLDSVLERDFFHARLGLFELSIPAAALATKETARDFRDISEGLLEAQERWVGWLGESAQGQEPLLKNLKTARAWVAGWNISKLRKAAREEGRDALRGDALKLFNPSDSEREALSVAASAMASRQPLGRYSSAMSSSAKGSVRLVLMPSRAQFVEFATFIGALVPRLRSVFWVDSVRNWSEFRFNDLQVIAMQYAVACPRGEDYSDSSSMKMRASTGLEEQVVQLGMNKLLTYEHGAQMSRGLIGGLSINMIIEQYGACHTSLDGCTEARVTNARSQFVPGGLSQGGVLPQNVALNRWRREHGKHHYLRTLRRVQKAGAKATRGSKKIHSFLLMGPDERVRAVVQAPFLGGGVAAFQDLPQATHSDQVEFIRAYKTAFLFWLRTEAGGKQRDSARAFGKFLGRLQDSPGVEGDLKNPLEGPE